MFDTDQLIHDLVAANGEAEPRLAVRDTLDRALRRADDVAAAFDPDEGGLELLHNSPDFTVAHVVWAPGMVLYPHDHRMWAVIGIYGGTEENTFYRRNTQNDRSLTPSGGKRLDQGDLVVLGDDTIHGVSNPTRTLTGAIHVYGGDFVREPRSQWGPGEMVERPYDLDEARGQFAEANARWRMSGPG